MNNSIFSGGKKWEAQEKKLFGKTVCQACEMAEAATSIPTFGKTLSGEWETVPVCLNCFHSWKQAEGDPEEIKSNF